MLAGILGKKLGMTQVFRDDGRVVPVTVIEAGPCPIVQVKTKEKDGYGAIQLGFDEVKEKSLSKAEAARFKKANITPKKVLRELKTVAGDEFKVGDIITVEKFEAGDALDITGTSIGKGFQGGMKRWGWSGGDAGHGSMFHRRVGSIQSGPRLSRITKGHHMPGRMGHATVTIQNIELIKVDKDNNLLIVKGAVPGHINSYLMIKKAKKRLKAQVLVKSTAKRKDLKKSPAKATAAKAGK